MMNYLNTYRRYACDIDRINEEAARDPENLINMTEKVYRHDLRMIVEQIMSVPGKRHVIMLSGPSSSGKTTTAKKLADEFLRHGVDAQLISMDDFYLGAEKVGRLPDGKPDFESVEALDIPLIKKTIDLLSDTGECVIPKYDFSISGRSSKTQEIRLGENSVIIMEGIHALNPIFSEGMSRERLMKIYVSVKQGIKSKEDYILTNRDIRFIRRIVRDSSFRKVDPEYMLSMWNSVVEGEKKYIRPYRYTGDFTVNSIHIYEPCVMRNIAIGIFDRISPSSEGYDYICRLRNSLEKFREVSQDLVPQDSLIREFFGGGCYKY